MTPLGLEALVQALAPGGKLRSKRRLRGGLGALMHVLSIDRADGSRLRVSLRRYIEGYRDFDPDQVRADFDGLLLVEAVGIPAARPLLLDAEGRYFGGPCIVLSFIPGSSRYQPVDKQSWTRQLAAAAARIHAVTPHTHDLSSLRPALKPELRTSIEGLLPNVDSSDEPLARAVHDALLANLDLIEWPEPCLVHDDFWPGNTVWFRSRLVAVIDWGDAKLGDRRTDIAQAELELAFTIDKSTAAMFVSSYEEQTAPLPHLWFFQLYRGLYALLYARHWLDGYRDAGLNLDAEEVLATVRWFVQRALDEAAAFKDSRGT